ncbi:MAG: type III-A CRISPR-associated RAMP protein Csm3 [Caldimicrobium sp.]
MFEYQGSYVIEYTLRAITGLRIGGSKEQFEIGGLDNPVIKVEMEIPDYDGKGHILPKDAPYIPGSSLKGKIRSLLEWANGRVQWMIDVVNKDEKIEKQKKIEEAGKACKCGKCEICKVFGTGEAKKVEEIAKEGDFNKIPGPPRLKVFDAYPTWETLERLKEALGENIFTEIKTENQINRLTSRANPRKVERVPAGAEFEGVMIFDVYKEEDKKLLKIIFSGMKMLEDSYLGGYGSRGSGRVKIIKTKVKWRSKEFYLGKEAEKTIAEGDLDKIIEEIKKFSLNFA